MAFSILTIPLIYLSLLLLTIASLPLVSDMHCINKRSFLKQYTKLKINSTFYNMWHLADLNVCNALHLLFAKLLKLLIINQIIKQLNVK